MDKGEEDIKINVNKIFPNIFTTIFFVLFCISLSLSFLSVFGVNLGIGIINQLLSAFPGEILWALTFALSVSIACAYFKKFKWMFLPIIIWLLFTTAVIRTSNIPQLKDITTGEYTLGPDLDPFLYWRHAIEISEGRLQNPDYFRQAPIGVESYAYKNLMPWVIFWLYKLLSIFSDITITYSAIITPVILFIISVIGFLLFVKTIASFKMSEEKSWITAIIAGLFYVNIPEMLQRTVAGIPEIESLGMAWFWFAFLFLILAWKEKISKKMMIYGALAGIFTGLMSWSWGGYRYIYMILSLVMLLFFLFNKDKQKILIFFSSWIIPALVLEFLKVKSIMTMLMGFADVGLGIFVWFVICLDYLIYKTRIKEMSLLKKINLPESIKSIIIGIILMFFITLAINPGFIINIFSSLIGRLIHPFGLARISLTVAENKAPYLTEVLNSFGYLFWIFLLGNFIFFYEAIRHFERKKKIWFSLVFLIFLIGVSFTNFSPQSIFNGGNFISKFFYLGSIILFFCVLIFVYIKAHIKKDERTIEDFNNVDFIHVLLLSFGFIAMISMRGAIRLFFIVSPILIILASFVPIKLFTLWKNKSGDLTRLCIGILLVISIIFMIITFASYSAQTTNSVGGVIPSSYNQQWQEAMNWVRNNTPENSIFVHWWDYGYWVQTLGERPTVTDGAHANAWWDHTTARYLLTTPKPETALSLMKTHNVSYLLIDSSDLGKYPAYSSIGSDNTGEDRFAQIPLMVFDPSLSSQTAESEIRIYQGAAPIDGDIDYSDGNNSIFVPSKNAFIIGMVMEVSKNKNLLSIKQPTGVFFYNNKQIRIPLRYVYYRGEIVDFKTGIEGIVRVVQAVSVNGQNVTLDDLGSIVYLSPKVSKSLFAELYMMNDPFNKYKTVGLAHSQSDPIVSGLRSQGMNLDELIYFQGFRGPIDIWKVEYPDNILKRDEFLKNNGEYAELDNLQFIK